MNKETKDQFTIEVSSDLDYEKMVVNLNFGTNQVAILNCDKQANQVEIKLLDRYEDKVVWTFDFQAFISALNLAVEKLKQANN
jgi:hypothetical protein